MVDTITLESPNLASDDAEWLRYRLKTFETRIEGEITREITRDQLLGSFDSRLSIMLLDHRMERPKDSLVPVEVSCPPFLKVELSLPKWEHGFNGIAIPYDPFKTLSKVHAFLCDTLSVRLHDISLWKVVRVDWAANFLMPQQQIFDVHEYLEKFGHYPRRKSQPMGQSGIYWYGDPFFKCYHKGLEQYKHDRKRLKRRFGSDWWNSYLQVVDNTLRMECSIGKNRLAKIHPANEHTGKHRPPLVSSLDLEAVRAEFSRVLCVLFPEAKSTMEIVSVSSDVRLRLDQLCTKRGESGRLFGFYMELCLYGEKQVRSRYSPASFRRNRADLVGYGVSWKCSDLSISLMDTKKPVFSFRYESAPVFSCPADAFAYAERFAA